MKKLYLLLFCIILAANMASAQNSKKKKSPVAYNKQSKENEKFLEKQWWLGAKGGVNVSKVNLLSTYSILAPTNYAPSASAKKYEKFKQLGSQATFEVTFYFKGFGLSFQPTYQHSRFLYTNRYEWTDSEDATQSLIENYEQDQKLDHVLLPLIVKYEITGNKLRPYVQGGIYSAILINANKTVTISREDKATGATRVIEEEPIIVGAKELFAKNHWGLLGGAGVNYNLGNVRLNLDIQYKYGMSNITSVQNRYSNDSLAGIGDSMDDLTLDNLSISVGCLFPMRFLESGFKSLDRK